MEEKDMDVSENEEIVEETVQEIVDPVEETAEDDQQVINEEVQSLNKKNEELTNKLLRLQAEFDNFKKRTAKEKSAQLKYKAEDFAEELLPVMDNFERALQTEITEENKGFYDGVTMVYNQLKQAFESQGIEPVKTVNQAFDPNIHHAVMQVEEEDKESNVVIEELQKGYMLQDKVIRPAMVKVNK